MRNNRIVWVIAAAAAVLLLAGTGITAVVLSRASGPAPASATPTLATSSAPTPTTAPPSPGADLRGPLDLLLIGVDTRVSIADWEPHSDALMLLHLNAGLDSGYLYSLPRDLRVEIPAYPKAGFAGGRYKITEAMSRGSRVPGSRKISTAQGYQLLARTVEKYTGITEIQAGAILNFGGLDKLVDTLGGITMTIDQKVVSIHRRPDGTKRTMQSGGGGYYGPQQVYQKGTRKLNGWQAIDYARQRYTEGGDYTRQRHQRQMVRALLTTALDQNLADDTGKLRTVIDSLGDSLIYVGGRTPLEYAYALRNLTPANLTLVNLPGASVFSGGGYIGEELTATGRGFLTSVASGDPAAYLIKHQELT